MATNEKYCLRWNDFESNISTAFRELREEKDFFDVTLACDDKQVQAHKVILSACSPFFRSVLRRNPHQHPLLYLRGVKYNELVNVLNFMYQGEVNIAQEELTEFLSVADDLRVKGLAQGSKTQGQTKPDFPVPAKDLALVNNGPPSKRKRPSPSPDPQCSTIPQITFSEESDIQEVVPHVKQEPMLITPSVMVDEEDPIETSENLVLEGNPHYGESYDGFQYDGDQPYDETQMMDSSMGDGNKGVRFSQEAKAEMEFYIVRVEDPTGQKRVSCKICSKSYPQRDMTNLRRHLESKHLGGKFNCDVCRKPLKRKNAVCDHNVIYLER